MDTGDGTKKKLLALDGGGIRGVISIEVLGAIERILQEELGRGDDFVLADYFDYVAGTSTGAIIATAVALGWRVDAIRQLYALRGAEMFDRAALFERFHQRYGDRALRDLLQELFGRDTTLGSPSLQALLMVVLRNATTDSAWPISSNPRAVFNQPGHAHGNLGLPLWQLVRASTAAPTFFPPEVISFGEGESRKDHVFVDGGLTMFNNPSFQLFLMATHEAYNLNWDVGEDRMLIISIGTGATARANPRIQPGDMNLLFNASAVPGALMRAASAQQDLLCRILGRLRFGREIDRELGRSESGPLEPRLFAYARYDADLSREGLDAAGLGDIVPEHVQRLDSIAHIADLQRVGVEVAQDVSPEHFAGFLEA